ncbi:MAG: hypothetical protein KC619_21790 [Myxococcales bacterium]|nr:hypothetical protein [Myxococcales bacterium]
MSALLGSDSFPVRRFTILWTLLGAYVLGATGLLLFDRDGSVMLLIALLPAVASALGVVVATHRSEGRTSLRILGATTLALMACPLLFTLFVVFPQSPPTRTAESVGLLLLVACLGGVLCAPFGVAFGGVFAGVYWQLDLARGFGRSAREQLWMRFGGASLAQGVIVLLVAAVMPTGFGPSSHVDLLVPLGVGALVFGVLTAGRGLALAIRRRRLVGRVRRGEVAGWAVLPRASVPIEDDLPTLFGPGGAEVLVRRATDVEGPFRSNGAIEPVALL